jgi:glyoxylase-like metal-dependent hydrolase (beta-lactamase superfamily II)
MNYTFKYSVFRHDIFVLSETGPTGAEVNAYLITGSKRALLIDTLWLTENLYEKVRTLTDLPLDVAFTHGHLDHVGKSTQDFYDAGCNLYLDSADNELVKTDENISMDLLRFTPYSPQQHFDLGGYILEVIRTPGHTQGSISLLDREHQIIFTGDSLGSGGFWLWLPYSTTVSDYKKVLDNLWSICGDMNDLIIETGHRDQCPVQADIRYFKDLIYITDGIVNGSIKGKMVPVSFGNEKIMCGHVAYGLVGDYTYDPERVR